MSDLTRTPKKTIAFVIPGGVIARYFLRTGLLQRLLADSLRILILTPNHDEEYFREEFKHPDIHIEPLELEKMNNYVTKSKLQVLLRTLRIYNMYDLSTIKLKYEDFRRARGKWTPRHLLFDTVLFVFHKSRTVRKVLLALECRLFNPRFHKETLARYRPDLLICCSPGFGRFAADAFLLREAKSQRVKTLSVISNWDHPSSKGWRGAMPDQAAVWSEVMKKELVENHQYPAKRCSVVGSLLFDIHFKKLAFSREEFLQRIGLDPERKTIVFYTWEPVKYPYHEDIIKILGEAIKKGQFIKKVQLVVRLHYFWFQTNIPRFYSDKLAELCRSYSHIIVDRSPILSTKLAMDIPGSENERLSALLRYSDILLNLLSTAILEACIHDVPVVNINFNGYAREPVSPDYDIHRASQFTHHLRAQKAQAARTAKSPEEFIQYINMYLENPALDRENRLRLVKEECGYSDGGSVDRLVSVIKNIINK